MTQQLTDIAATLKQQQSTIMGSTLAGSNARSSASAGGQHVDRQAPWRPRVVVHHQPPPAQTINSRACAFVPDRVHGVAPPTRVHRCVAGGIAGCVLIGGRHTRPRSPRCYRPHASTARPASALVERLRRATEMAQDARHRAEALVAGVCTH